VIGHKVKLIIEPGIQAPRRMPTIHDLASCDAKQPAEIIPIFRYWGQCAVFKLAWIVVSASDGKMDKLGFHFSVFRFNVGAGRDQLEWALLNDEPLKLNLCRHGQ
jgi:hypothetical protein